MLALLAMQAKIAMLATLALLAMQAKIAMLATLALLAALTRGDRRE